MAFLCFNFFSGYVTVLGFFCQLLRYVFNIIHLQPFHFSFILNRILFNEVYCQYFFIDDLFIWQIFTGKFYEMLIGQGTGTFWNIISTIATFYILEPIFTVIFVINMTVMWEKVMASLRGQIFKRMLIQKVDGSQH